MLRLCLNSIRVLVCCFIAAAHIRSASAAQPQVATQFDFSSDTTPGARKFYFETIPGHRYTLWRSTDLQNWAPVPSYPQTAAGLSVEHTFTQDVKEFFQIEPIDDQAPEIVEQFPGVDSYAVRRFDDLRFLLSDVTGIDLASIRLTLGNGSALSIGAPGLTFVNNVLTYDTGDAALGAYGAAVSVTLTMADTLGHSVTHTFSFTLEVLPKVVPNLYVFGSPAAQRAGQRIPATPTAALAKQTGPVRMDSADPWEISSVLPDRVVIAYTGTTAPVFAANTYLANLTPVKLSDIFYRKILSVSDAPAAKALTLMTTDVPLAEILEEGTATLSADSVVYELGEGGSIQPAVQPALQGSFSRTFPRVGINKDGAGPLSLPGDPKYSVSLPEANVWFTPSLDISFETKGFSLRRASVQARGDVEAALVVDLTYRPESAETEKEWPLHSPLTKLAFVGSAGPVPVWLDFTYTTKLKFEAEANVALTLRAGLRGNYSMTAGVSYTKDVTPSIEATHGTLAAPLELVPPTVSIGGTAKAKLSLVPQLDVSLQSLVGFYVNATPRLEAELSASAGCTFLPKDGTVLIGGSARAQATLGAFIDLNAGLKLWPLSQAYLPAFDPYRLYTWGNEFSFPPPLALAFTVPVAMQAVGIPLGNTLILEGQAKGGTGAIFYQWYHNGILLPGQTSRQLIIPNVVAGNAGAYSLRARAGTETVTSPAFTVTIYNPVPAVNGFTYIPAGSFQMGDQSYPLVGNADELPVHRVYLSGFYMGRTEVTWVDWRTVRDWAVTHGYPDLSGQGAGKADSHPVHSISWYEMVKWCNAKSEKEGLTPCYTVSGALYRTGDNNPDCNWSANGYRLPTESEWEKAARGGNSLNFPWGNTISHTQANYYSSQLYNYDVNPTIGYHPDFVNGDLYTSPVGSFSPNSYGLYDTSGNLYEWCWDRYGNYGSVSQFDFKGPTGGLARVLRGGSWGGSWYDDAQYSRVANRELINPSIKTYHLGFRFAKSLDSSSLQPEFSDEFNGGSLDAAKWSVRPGANVSLSNGIAAVTSGPYWTRPFDTLGKYSRQSNTWIVEFRMKRDGAYDAGFELTDGTNSIWIMDSVYSSNVVGPGLRISTSGIFGDTHQAVGGATENWMEYRLRINGTNLVCERGITLDSITQSISLTLPVPIASAPLSIRCSNAGHNQASFDWIRVR